MTRPERGVFLSKIGAHLRKLRLLHEKSSKEIASYLGITTQAYGNIERGKSDVCISKLLVLAAYYEKTIAELVPEELRTIMLISENNFKYHGLRVFK